MAYELSGLKGVPAEVLVQAQERISAALRKGVTPDLSDLDLSPTPPPFVPNVHARSSVETNAYHGEARLSS